MDALNDLESTPESDPTGEEPGADDNGSIPDDGGLDPSQPEEDDDPGTVLAMPEETRHDIYREAAFEVPRDNEPHTLDREVMADIVGRIVEIEGPIHEDEIARRVAGLWSYGRTGRRIVEATSEGLRIALERGIVLREGPFCYFGEYAFSVVRVRDRANVASPTLRRPDMLAPPEISAALIHIAQSNFSVGMDEIISHAGRLFGFRAVSAQLRAVLEKELASLLDTGQLDRAGMDVQIRR